MIDTEVPGTARLRTPSSRVASIDIVRGLAMVVMALDHVRDYISNIPFEPEDINHTWPFYFFVRWITHFCAPAFFLLTGVGAYLYGRKHTPGELQGFLVTRGLWLLVLEFTVIGFAWSFQPGWSMFQVIGCLGCAMILLAAVVRLPRWAVMGLALVVIGCHDHFDALRPKDFGQWQWLVTLLHSRGVVHLGERWEFVLFPLVPWFAVTMLGFAMGGLFEGNTAKSRRTLVYAGVGALALFAVLRSTNVYGNPAAGIAKSSPGDWHVMASWSKTAILFLDVEKYPPSLDYLLMTLGTIFILLAMAAMRDWRGPGRVLAVYGRVPLFYYILHLFAAHLAAVALAAATGQPWQWLLHNGFFTPPPEGQAYGHGLAVICGVWVLVVAVLYVPCAWFAGVKRRHPDSLLRFL